VSRISRRRGWDTQCVPLSCLTSNTHLIYIKSFLVEFPRVVATAAGPDDSDEPPRVLFDPIFSNTAGPSPWLSIQRRLPPPCTLTELPEFQFVVYSHNQCVLSLCESLPVFIARPKITCSYDHLDLPTLQQIHALRRQYVHFLVPLGQFLYPFPHFLFLMVVAQRQQKVVRRVRDPSFPNYGARLVGCGHVDNPSSFGSEAHIRVCSSTTPERSVVVPSSYWSQD
jgi:hypothetical protein